MPAAGPVEKHVHACPLCEAMCGLVIETQGQAVTSIRGDDDDPFSRGHVCPKAVALKDLHEDPDRLRRPMKRVHGKWEPVSWSEALDFAAQGLLTVQRMHGRNAVATFAGNPTVHSVGASLFLPQFIRALGTRSRYSATSVDQLPHHVAAATMFGHPLLIPIPDIDRTQHLVIIGGNPLASNGSLMTAPDVAKRLKAIRARGGKVVVVDPRKTETALVADEHYFIRPGADVFLLLAMLHVILKEGLDRPSRARDLAVEYDELWHVAKPYTPERVAHATGILPGSITAIARDFANAERAALYGRVGVSMQEFGGVACWLITALNLVTGRVDEPGGVMFTNPAIDPVGLKGGYSPDHIGRWKSRVRGLPEFMGELPVATLAEEIETDGEGQVRALVTHAGNPVLSTPNGGRLDRALERLEFMVSIDFYLNETTRHADVILPPVGPLERDHYDVVFHTLAIRNTAKYAPPLFDPPANGMPDWKILSELTERVQPGWNWTAIKNRMATRAIRKMGVRGLLDHELAKGPYAHGTPNGGAGLTTASLMKRPHGVDLGALVPMLPHRLRTTSKKIHAAPKAILADLPRVAKGLEAASERHEGVLMLIGRRELRSNNSWMHNSERLVRGKARCTLLMHPDDASHRNLADGQMALVISRVGAVEAPVEITDAMMPGVVSLPHGWGHGRPGVQMKTAAAHAGVSINDLTDDERVDRLCGTAGFSGTRVTVERVG
ncbi:MAG: molybdopterin-dependent oxidoreductase [Gemmatimonadetes bacterium]|nr:molybdopterin-dependent oxidoreductase [Gemmatimonadota bacterium]